MLYDNHGRLINYLRLAVTDRCNLRCTYCMPAQGIQYLPKSELMSYEEMLYLVRLLADMGIEKVRITGGEPFVRADLMNFLDALSQIEGLKQINLTTNGAVTAPHIPALKAMGIHSVNLSLDTLNAERFFKIARRDVFYNVMNTFEALLKHDIRTKINAVIMQDKNDVDIIPLAMLTKDLPVDLRFIEEMPFNGKGAAAGKLFWNHRQILTRLREHFPEIVKVPDLPHSTSSNYQIPGHQGKVGIIAAFSRTFCGTCNRIRLTPQGLLKTCLYDNGVFNAKDLLRSGADDEQLKAAFLKALGNRAKDGFEAEKRRDSGLPVSESMATIGG